MELDYTTTDDDITLLKDLEVGDWFTFKSQSHKCYVYRVVGDTIYYSSPSLANSHSYDTIGVDFKVKFLGKSKPNFWYKFFWWTNAVHPVKLIKN